MRARIVLRQVNASACAFSARAPPTLGGQGEGELVKAMSKQHWSLVAALVALAALAPSASVAQTHGPYFVGTWVFDRKTCTNPTRPGILVAGMRTSPN